MYLFAIFSPLMKNEIVLGIDIGGTFTKVGIVNAAGTILKNTKFKTGAKGDFTDFVKRLQHEIDGLLGDQELLGIGVGAPNANPFSGTMDNPPNFRWGSTVPLTATLKKRFDIPIYIANDANASAIGEMEFGLAKGMKNFVVLTLGTGLGSGIISNGNLLIGQHGMAGELGHVNVDPRPNARQCNCGLQGCLETYVSVTGIRRTIFELIAEMRDDSLLRGISFDDMTGEIISDAALQGDAIALQAFRQTAEVLGVQMADTAAHLDPEAFILLGGLSKAGDILVTPTVKTMEQHMFNAYQGKIKVLISETPGDNAILGPAALVLRELRKKNNGAT